jgi:hypothetical protein
MPTVPYSCASVPLSASDFTTALGTLGVDAPTAWSILTVESGKAGYLPDRRPQILFERAVFSRQTGGAYDASNPDISQPNWGGYIGGAAEYTRLAEAYALNQDAAFQSASWGLGQIMGFNFKNAGYTSAEAMVADACASEAAQLTQFINFLTNTGIVNYLQVQDWNNVARLYNGLGQVAKYSGLLSNSYTTLSAPGGLPDLSVRAAQLYLRFLAAANSQPTWNVSIVDGVIGPRTLGALNAFQTAQGIATTSEVDDDVLASLSNALPAPVDLNIS